VEQQYLVKNGWPYKLLKVVSDVKEAEEIKEELLEKTEYDVFYKKSNNNYYIYISLHPRKIVKGII